MRHLKKSGYKGMTFTELLITVLAGTLLIGIVFGAWYFIYKRGAVEQIRTRLRINLEIAMEHLKEEVRLSSATYMSLYPFDAAEYSAISFPQSTPQAQDFLTLDPNGGNIVWDKSIIYFNDESMISDTHCLR